MLLLLVVAYFVATSSWFLKRVVLPKAGAALNARVTAEDVSLHRFSSLTVTGLKVRTTGPEPLFQAASMGARFNLWDLLGGRIRLAEATLGAAQVHLVENADGTRNFDPLLKALTGPPSAKPKPASAEPRQIDIQRLALTGVSLRWSRGRADGGAQAAELSKLSLLVDRIANGRAGNVRLSGEMRFDQGLPGPSNGVITATLEGALNLALSAALKPSMLRGNVTLVVPEAQGPFRDAAGLRLALDADLAQGEVRELALRLAKAEQPLATLVASGPFDVSRLEGALTVALHGIDRRLLNLAGSGFGGDFNATTLSSTNAVELTQRAELLKVAGRVGVNQFSLSRQGLTSPPLELAADYNVTLDRGRSNALVQTLTLLATRDQHELLRGGLRKPMVLDWSGGAGAVEDSFFDVALRNADLADWRVWAVGLAPAGKLDCQWALRARQSGAILDFDLTNRLAGFSATVGEHRLTNANLELTARGELEQFRRLRLSALRADLRRLNEPTVSLSTAGSLDTATRAADLEAAVEAQLPGLTALLGNSAVSVSAGSLKFNGRLSQNSLAGSPTGGAFVDRSFAGRLQLENLTGRFGDSHFDRLAADLECDLSLTNQLAELRKLALVVRQAGQDGGTLSAAGTYDFSKTNGQGALFLRNLNENALRPLAGPLLGSNRLGSASINLDTAAVIDLQAGSTLKGDLRITNVVLRDAQGRLAQAPLKLEVAWAGSLTNDLTEIRQLTGRLQHGSQEAGLLQAACTYHLKERTGQATLLLTNLNQLALQPLLAPVLGDRSLSSVSISLDGRAGYKAKGDSTFQGDLRVADLLVTATNGPSVRAPLSLVVKLDGLARSNHFEARQCLGYVSQGELVGGSFDLKGQCDLDRHAVQAELRLLDLNQNALRPLLAGALGDRTLESVSINCSADLRYDPQSESAVKADFQAANLLMRDPAGKLPSVPLRAGLKLEASLLQRSLDLRLGELTLTDTPRARNQLRLAGKLDLRGSNSLAGNLTLNADALDLTPYYDLWTGARKPQVVQPAGGSSSTGQDRSIPPKEPDPIRLPLDFFTLQTTIGRLYLREIDIADFATTVRIEGGRVKVDPLGLTLNGAPISGRAAVNLGVPGFEYDVALEARLVPLGPILSTFQPERPEPLNGFVSTATSLSGAGVLAPSLRRNLGGNVSLGLTNANLQLLRSGTNAPSPWRLLVQVVKTIAFVTGIPELTRSPITRIDTRADVAAGTVHLRQALFEGPLYQLASSGTISLADAPEESRLNELPVHMSLERNLAIRSRLAPASTPPEQTYVRLPTFLTLSGTVDHPRETRDPTALAKLALELGNSQLQDAAKSLLTTPALALPGVTGAQGGTAPAAAPSVTMPAKPALPTTEDVAPPKTPAPKTPELPKTPQFKPTKPSSPGLPK